MLWRVEVLDLPPTKVFLVSVSSHVKGAGGQGIGFKSGFSTVVSRKQMLCKNIMTSRKVKSNLQHYNYLVEDKIEKIFIQLCVWSILLCGNLPFITKMPDRGTKSVH
jgi:hypothetical protein